MILSLILLTIVIIWLGYIGIVKITEMEADIACLEIKVTGLKKQLQEIHQPNPTTKERDEK